jgi:hypothetical protein
VTSKLRVVKGIIDSNAPPGKSLAVATVETSGDVGGDVCVGLKNDEQDKALIPGTFKLTYQKKQVQNVALSEKPISQGERKTCQFVTVTFQTVFQSYAYVNATGTMEVFVAVPND